VGAHLPFQAREATGGNNVMHGQCNARRTVTIPAYTHTKLTLLGDRGTVCEQLAQGRTRQHSSQDLISQPTDRTSSTLAAQPPSHTPYDK